MDMFSEQRLLFQTCVLFWDTQYMAGDTLNAISLPFFKLELKTGVIIQQAHIAGLSYNETDNSLPKDPSDGALNTPFRK